jgi:hypothetical protein
MRYLRRDHGVFVNGIVTTMKTKLLQDVLERVETWPESAQNELAELALDIEAGLGGDYQPTPAELAGIDRGLKAANDGRFASDEEVEAAFAKFRRA